MQKEERRKSYETIFMCARHVHHLWEAFALDETPISFDALEGGEDNLNIALRDARGQGLAVARHYLVTPSEKVAAELKFVEFLVGHGFPTPSPIPTRQGQIFLNNGTEPGIALFRFVNGRHIKAWTPAQRSVGARELAHIHQLCARHDYRIGRNKNYIGILEDGLSRVAALALPDTDIFMREVKRFLSHDVAENQGRLSALPFGPVHHDLNTGNVFWNRHGDLKAIIDFDEAHDAPLVMDLVAAFQYLALDPVYRLKLPACRDLLCGYSEIRPLAREETSMIQFCWNLSTLVGATEFITDNSDWLESAMECRSFSQLYLKNRAALNDLS